MPWDTPAQTTSWSIDPDGVFFSNGPGDPEAGRGPTAEAARAILGKKPVFGICLGNQLISIAAGAAIEKLPYGHHGGNEPVHEPAHRQGRDHGPEPQLRPRASTALGPLVPALSGRGVRARATTCASGRSAASPPSCDNARFGRIRLTHVNLNDGTPEGIQFLDVPAFSVQYHPEACPGPHDSAYLFEAFCRLMEGRDDYLAIDVREGRRF